MFSGLLEVAFLVGLSSFVLVRLTRKLVPKKWLESPPVGCNLCMSFWSSIALGGFLHNVYGTAELIILTLGSWAASLLLLEYAETLAPPTFVPPE